MILTDEEIAALQHLGGGISPRAVEAAVLAKLAAGVSMEPDFREIADCVIANLDDRKGVLCLDVDADTEEEIRQEAADAIKSGIATTIAAARVQENERCAEAVEYTLQDGLLTVDVHAKRIRALLGKEST